MSSRAGAAWCARRTSRRIEPIVSWPLPLARSTPSPRASGRGFTARGILTNSCVDQMSRCKQDVMRKRLIVLIALIAMSTAQPAPAETLKVAVAQRGFWNSTFIDVGLKQGYFKDVGLDIEILYTEGGASTLTPVIAGSIDIAMTNGILGVVAAYAKGMPVRIISAEATGAAEAFWYARPESGIRRLADTSGKTVAYSSPGSSTNLILLQLVQQAKAAPKLVATGGAPATLTQVMSGQIDVGWSVPPFVLQQLTDGKLVIIAR